MRTFLKKPLVLKILSIVLAVFIWAYVINLENPETDHDLRSVKVAVNTEGSVPYQNGLAITDGLEQTIDIKVRGRHNALANYDFDSIVASVDINSVTKEGQHTLPVSVYVPGDNVWLVNHSPTTLTFTFSKITSQTIPVEIVLKGNVNSEYIIDSSQTDPQTITVSGPSADVNYLSHAEVTVDVSNLKTDLNTSGKLVLINKDNSQAQSKFLTTSQDNVDVSLKVLKKKTVPLNLELEGNNVVDEQNHLLFNLTPTTIDICGTDAIVDAIQSIELGTLNVEGMRDGEERTIAIPLPDGVKNLSAISAVKVTAYTAQSQTRTISGVPVDTSQLESIDLQNAVVHIPSNQIDVTISGNASDIEQVNVEDITVTADFSNLDLTQGGQQQVALSVFIGEDKNVMVVGQYHLTVEVEIPQ